MPPDTEEAPTATRFADRLADLKQRGSTILLTGVDSAAREAACSRLLGDASVASRKRLFVRVGSEQADGAPTANANAESRHITYRTATRATATASDAGVGTAPARVVDGDLPALRTAIEEEMRSLTGPSTPPGALRVCIEDVDSIVAAHDLERVFTLFHGLEALAREHDAMVHGHHPGRFDDETVQTLVPLFDAVVEVREGPHQRWHLQNPDLTTDWLTL